MKLRDRFSQFMIGRYGVDQFSKFLSTAAIIFVLIAWLARVPVLSYLGIAIIVYLYFRMFSKNISKRYEENQKYLKYSSSVRILAGKYTAGFRKFIDKKKYEYSQRKVYHIYKCPNCSQKIRIPKGKGRIQVRCPKCYTEFIKNS